MNVSKHTVSNNAITAVTGSKRRDSETDSAVATWELERESSRPTTTRTELESAACRLVEKLSERASSTRERATLALHGIVWIITIVETLS
jgi:hypothetical protein